MGLPFLPIKSYQGSDYPACRPDLKQLTDPYTGQRTLVAPPIIPDVCILHGYAADHDRNVLISRTTDAALAAKAAKITIVSVEKMVDNLHAEADENTSRLPWVYVDAVVVAPGGAKPTGCPGRYEYDIDEVKKYIASHKNGRVDEYLAELTGSNQ